MLFDEIESNLRFAFPNYDSGFWAQANVAPFDAFSSQSDLGLSGGIPSSVVPFPWAREDIHRSVFKECALSDNQVVEPASKLNLENAIISAKALSTVQPSALIFEPHNERLSFARIDSPFGKYVTLRSLRNQKKCTSHVVRRINKYY